MSHNTIRAADISAERMRSGGWLLAIMHDNRRIAARYFGYTLRQARAEFLADLRAGIEP